ncbi:beta-glucosidase 12-like [Gossypium arboreum]|uniref:beta-glucosidase 12-like n=1 Tax=Gossypium arboreum TaxID=29729 RepID=UPI0022F18B80|nr:beta-glucosidase 12-like [Gossypium arboreum]
MVFVCSCLRFLTFAFAVAQKPQKWIGEPSSDSEESFVNVKRSDFRADFVFGASTAAAQIEGSEKSKGKRPTVWDQFIRKLQDKIVDNSSLEVAIDLHNCYKV